MVGRGCKRCKYACKRRNILQLKVSFWVKQWVGFSSGGRVRCERWEMGDGVAYYGELGTFGGTGGGGVVI